MSMKLMQPSKTPIRAWINTPSAYNRHHEHHGKNVLAMHEYDHIWRVFFLSGDLIGMQVEVIALSPGWK